MITLIQNADWSILYMIHNGLSCAFMDVVMPEISALGNMGMIWVLTGLIMMCTKKYRKCGIALIAGAAMCFLIGSICLKPLFARPRPCWIDHSIRLLIKNETDYSFPSGHTLVSFASAYIIFKGNKKFGYFAFVIAFLIGFSRLYLFVHFPSEVLAGAVLGIVIGYAAYVLTDRFYAYVSQRNNIIKGPPAYT